MHHNLTSFKTIKNKLFILAQYLLPHRLINLLAKKITKNKNKTIKNHFINLFIKKYKIDLSQCEITNPKKFVTFNDFFTRALKPNAREFGTDNNIISCPIDGFVSQIASITKDKLMQAKNHDYTLLSLTAGYEQFYHPFTDGKYTTLYLSPKDYHRIHMPISGKLKQTLFVPGKFFSVSVLSNDNIPNIYSRNTRLLCLFDTEHGPMCVIFIGAMVVGQIVTKWSGEQSYSDQPVLTDYSKEQIKYNKGDEIGHFELGSSVILLFNDNITWSNQFHCNDPIKMGVPLGKVKQKPT